MYFDIKVKTEVDGKSKTQSYVVECESILEVHSKVAESDEFKGTDYTISSISEGKYINDLSADTSEIYWKVGLVWENPDGKEIKELYLVEGENMNLVRDKVIEGVDDTSIENFEKHSLTKILGVIK